MRREFAAVLPRHNPRCLEGLHVRRWLVLVANSTSVVLGWSLFTARGGKEVTCSEPGDTSSVEGDGGDATANEAANGVMLSSIISSGVISICRNY